MNKTGLFISTPRVLNANGIQIPTDVMFDDSKFHALLTSYYRATVPSIIEIEFAFRKKKKIKLQIKSL